jgi:hypothetical protein
MLMQRYPLYVASQYQDSVRLHIVKTDTLVYRFTFAHLEKRHY